MKWLALFGFLLIQDPDIDSLLKQLSDELIEVREKAAAALLEVGEKAEPKLKERLSTASGELKARYESLLAAIEKARKRKAVLPPIRRVTLEAKDEPIRDVLENLRIQTGLPVDIASAPDGRVSVSIAGALPLQALDAVCAAADLEFVPHHAMGGWERDEKGKGGSIRLRAGHTRTPRTFAGPFVVSAPTISVTRWRSLDKGGKLTSNAVLSFSLYWPPDCKPTRLEKWQVLSALDDKGNELRREYDPHGLDFFRRNWVEDIQVYLDAPGEGAGKIAVVNGRVVVLFASGKATVEFRSPEACVGQVRKRGGVTARLDHFEATGDAARVKLQVMQEGDALAGEEPRRRPGGTRPFDLENLRLVLEDGSVASPGGSSTSGSPPKGMVLDVSFRGLKSKVAAIEISVDTAYERVELDFELKDIPLPK